MLQTSGRTSSRTASSRGPRVWALGEPARRRPEHRSQLLQNARERDRVRRQHSLPISREYQRLRLCQYTLGPCLDPKVEHLVWTFHTLFQSVASPMATIRCRPSAMAAPAVGPTNVSSSQTGPRTSLQTRSTKSAFKGMRLRV
jgi:hypothetical protein